MGTAPLPRQRRAPAADRRPGRSMRPSIVAFVDVVLINLAFFVAWYARYRLEVGAEIAVENYVEWSTYSTIQLALTAVLLTVFRLQGLYRMRRGAGWVDEMGTVLYGTLIGIAIMIVGAFYLRPFGLSRLIFVYAGVLILYFLGVARVVERIIQRDRKSVV